MQALKVVYRKQARADLADVFRYISDQGSPLSAAGYVRRLRGHCDAIGLAPNAGTPRDDLMPGLRVVGFERRAVIAYLVEGDRVRILDIFYGGRDLEAIYRGRRQDD
jgi:toxin ParE1/3/4